MYYINSSINFQVYGVTSEFVHDTSIKENLRRSSTLLTDIGTQVRSRTVRIAQCISRCRWWWQYRAGIRRGRCSPADRLLLQNIARRRFLQNSNRKKIKNLNQAMWWIFLRQLQYIWRSRQETFLVSHDQSRQGSLLGLGLTANR